MPTKQWQATYEDDTVKTIHGGPDAEAARRHAEHPAVNLKNIRNPSQGGHGRATITPAPPKR
jgi:hypothetical protein